MSEKTTKVTMRTPFPEHQISKLPKGTKEQNKCDAKDKINCVVCGGWHHPRVKHLDYVGHAALTDRLLDVDPSWFWEPLALKDGLPSFDATGGLWIKLTVNGVTRIGYGNALSKEQMDVGSREKEVIGDALRNAAMRFGAALELWHKGILHLEEEVSIPEIEYIDAEQVEVIRKKLVNAGDEQLFLKHFKAESIDKFPLQAYKEAISLIDQRIANKAKKEAELKKKAELPKEDGAV